MRQMLIFLFIFLLTGCSHSRYIDTDFTYPSLAVNETETGYPLFSERPTDSMSAFEAYLIAKDAAAKWDQEAILYEIPATFVMERNLGYPITGEGWFFKFKNPKRPLEYYIYIWDHKVSGTTEAQPITLHGEYEENLFPLNDLTELIDSDEVMNIFYESFSKNASDLKINLELRHTKDTSSPYWTVYDFSTLPEKVLMVVNAKNGHPLSLPRE